MFTKLIVKYINEIIEPKKPKGVKYGTHIHNKGTNSATLYHTFKFTTSLNNKVKILVKLTYENQAEISFFVNDVMDSDPKNTTDREILKGVFSYLPEIIKKFNLNKIEIEAHSDDGDKRILRKTPYDKLEKELKEKIIESLPTYKEKIKQYRQGYQDLMLNTIESFLEYLNGDESKWNIVNMHHLGEIGAEINKLYNEYRNAKLSHRPEGLQVKINRRYNIYLNLLPKFLPNWNITGKSDVFGSHLTLTKKE